MKNRFIRDGYTGRTLPRFCPSCFHILDAVSSMTGKEGPQPGDFSICLCCASVLRFTDKMDYELSALIEVPVEVRFEFVKAVNIIKSLGPYSNNYKGGSSSGGHS